MQRCAALACVLVAATAPSYAQTSPPSSSPSSPPAAAQPTSHASTKNRTSKRSRKAAGSRKRGQQKIDAQRARQIQDALIREHYLTGRPSGVWDNTTQAAMQKYQADNGWQSKTTPDARALIKMGLGPDHDHLLNPESAMTSELPPASSPARTDSSGESSKPQR